MRIIVLSLFCQGWGGTNFGGGGGGGGGESFARMFFVDLRVVVLCLNTLLVEVVAEEEVNLLLA
jgi:hypothetical protein